VLNGFKKKTNLRIDSSLNDVLASLLVDVQVFQRRNCDLLWFFLLYEKKYRKKKHVNVDKVFTIQKLYGSN